MTLREQTQAVKVGHLLIGGGNPVVVQSMTNTDTRDVDATVAQILRLEALGCELIRSSVYDEECALALEKIKEKIHIPIAADIHFSADLAVSAIEHGADKLRINPGNIGSAKRVKRVADAAKAHHVPIRVGVNAGSLSKEIRETYGVTSKAMVQSALEEIRQLEDCGLTDIIISMKASDVPTCVEAYLELAKHIQYPLHIGITEAGGGENGLIKSSTGLGALLLAGIGDTMRVSLSDAPEKEITAAWGILRACGVRKRGVEIISCPTCGRTCIDVMGIAREVEKRTAHITKHIKAAVMGCVVNGPGEAREADVGVAGGKDKGVLFIHGESVRSIAKEELLDTLLAEIEKLNNQ